MQVQVRNLVAREITLDQGRGGGSIDDIRLHDFIRRIVGTHGERPQREIGRQLADDAPCLTNAAPHEYRPRSTIWRAAVLMHEWQQQHALADGRVLETDAAGIAGRRIQRMPREASVSSSSWNSGSNNAGASPRNT